MSTVTFAGFSRVAGVLKFRTANDVKRIDQLRKLGDTDVVILQLPQEMSKNDAAKFVLTNLDSGKYFVEAKEAEALLAGLVKDENPFAKPVKTVAKKPQKVVKTVAKKPQAKPAVTAAPAMEFVAVNPQNAAKIRAQFIKKLFKEVAE
jgi:hypothetical protein